MYPVPSKDPIRDGWFVDRKIYTSEETLALEIERIFARTWHFACFVHDLKTTGDYFSMAVVDQPIILVRGADDEVRAFYNACTHRGAVLNNERAGNCGRMLKCMYHAWAFNLRGELVGVPHEEAYGPEFKRAEHGLKPVRCEIFCDLVFVTLNPAAPSLREYLGAMAPVLEKYATGITPILRNSWVYDGNWKLWHENFRDNYHPQYTHRGVNDMMPHYADRGGNWALPEGHSCLRWVAEKPNVANLARAVKRRSGVEFPPGGIPNIAGGHHEYREAAQEVLAIFPNLDVQPGTAQDAVGLRGSRMGHIQTVTPLSPHKTRVDYITYTSTDDDPVTRQAMLEGLADNQGSWGKVSNDDVEAAVRCQIGLRGRGTQYTPITRGLKPGNGGTHEEVDGRDEYSLREFYRVYEKYMRTAG